jgi:hypothetical protein
MVVDGDTRSAFEEADGLAAPHPVCFAGARVAPAEDRSTRSDGTDDCERVEPLSTDLFRLYEGLIRLAEARPDEVVRDVVGDMEEFGDGRRPRSCVRSPRFPPLRSCGDQPPTASVGLGR